MATPTAFPLPLRFRCREGCGQCCSYRVAVLAGETSFLARHGDAVVRRDAEAEMSGAAAIGHLRREDGHCVFLDADRRCTIYEGRPLYCRLFPLVRDSYPRRQIDANFSCLGIGCGPAFTEADYDGVAELEATVADLAAWEDRHQQAFEFACRSLSDRGAFTPPETMAAAARQLVRASLRAEPALEVGERLRRLVESSRPSFLSCGNLAHQEELLRLWECPETEGASPIADLDARTMCDYLDLWTRRNLLIRAAHAQGLASPLPVNVASHYLELLAAIATEVCEAGSRLSEAGKVSSAIRQVDAALRSRFMQASISLPS